MFYYFQFYVHLEFVHKHLFKLKRLQYKDYIKVFLQKCNNHTTYSLLIVFDVLEKVVHLSILYDNYVYGSCNLLTVKFS